MNHSKPDIDYFLVGSLRKGDPDSFEKLFGRYAQKLFVFSRSYLKNDKDAEEVVQEVFLKVWSNRESLQTGTSFQAYLFTISYNLVKKMFNEKAREVRFKLAVIDQLDEDSNSVDFEKKYQLVVQKLDEFIEDMPERRKRIFKMRKKEDISVTQIAELLGISKKTVENQITQAMKYLKKRFEDEVSGGLIFYLLFVDK